MRGVRIVTDTYFSRLVSQTPTRVWVNNPSIDELVHAQEQGAIGCTTNPTFGGGLLKRAPDEVRPIVDLALQELPDAPDATVADLVQRKLVARVVNAFRSLYDSSGGKAGFVSIQGSPDADMDGQRIWAEAQAARTIGPNATPKIPATLPGLDAFERVVARGWPVIVTEVFSLDQLAATCERFLDVTRRTGIRPPFFVSPITGILGDHLKKIAARDNIGVSAAELELAGVYLARRCAALVAERSYPVTLLFGGARTTFDLTGLVGAAHHATINWSTFAELIALDPPIDPTIDAPPDASIAERLCATFPDVWLGWELGRLAPEEFETFGPVQHFRDNFLAGWHMVVAEVATRRGVTIAAPR
jgi:transaldolase